MDISAARLANIGEHFDALLDLDAAGREAYLRDLDADPELVRELRAMLAADAQPLDLAAAVAQAYADVTQPIGTAEDANPDPAQFGPWIVRGVLGRGGMGVVYEVEREFEGSWQRAALKRIRGGVDRSSALARFAMERSILLRLQHRNIAAFLDAGAETDGTPWLVMERIDGVPLLDWCAQRKCGTRERVRLFAQLCEAVQFAHQHSVVHRDIKPGNVLVDTTGAVKLLDFGIAKFLGEASHSVLAVTIDGPMTPQYASPEQLRGQPASTLTDVYGLGTVLYELLSGQRPYARAGDSAPMACARVLSDEPCRPPSAVVRDTRELSGSVDPRGLRGDLDAIALRALARETDRRFGSVDALLDDVRRYLSGHPVRTRGNAWHYVFGRFLSRHRAASAAAGVVLFALIATSIVSWRAAEKARLEAERAEAAHAFLLSLFDAADPMREGFKLSALDIVSAGAQRLASGYAEQPEARAEAALTIGTILGRLGDAKGAVEQLAWEDTVSLPGSERRAGDRLTFLALAQLQLGELAAAESAAKRALEIGTAADRPMATARALSLLSEIARQRGDRQTAVALGARAASFARRVEAMPEAVDVLFQYTNVLRESDDIGAARDVAEETIAICATAPVACGYRLPKARIQLAPLQLKVGDIDGARIGLETALAEAEQWLPPSHPIRIDALSLLARIEGDLGQHEAAIEHAKEAVDLQRRIGSKSVLLGGYLNALGGRYSAAGREHDALASYRESVAHFEAIGQSDHPYALAALGNRGSVLARLAQYPDALADSAAAYSASQRVSGPEALTTLAKGVQLMRIRAQVGEQDLARELALTLAQSLIRQRQQAPMLIDLAIPVSVLLAGEGEHQAVLDLSGLALEGLRSRSQPQPLRESEVLTRQADALRQIGQLPAAIASANEALELALAADPDGSDQRTPAARIALAQCLAQSGNVPRARELLTIAIAELRVTEDGDSPRIHAATALIDSMR